MPPTLRQKNLATKPAQICDPPYSRNRSATRRRKASSPPNSSAPPTGQDNCGLELITVGFDFSTSNSVAVVEAKYGSNRELHQITHYPEHIDPTGEGPGIFTQSWYKDPSHPSSDPNQPSFLHGWEVMRMLGTKDRRIIGYHDGRRVERMKLLLDSSTHDTTLKAIESTVTVTNQDAHEQSSDQLSISVRHDLLNAIQESRKRLNVIAKRLVDEGIITQPTDVIKDWLVKWFMHIQEEVTNIHGYTESVPVNFAFAVPVAWSARTNAIFSTLISEALLSIEFGVREIVKVPKMKMFSEPEAVIMSLIERAPWHVKASDTVVVVDCGSGTIDGGSYRISSTLSSIRVDEEVQPPSGRCLGSSYINQQALKMAEEDLKHLAFTSGRGGLTTEGQIHYFIMNEFELKKRSFDTSREPRPFSFIFPGLRPVEGRPRLKLDAYEYSYEDMLSFFKQPMDAVVDVIAEQLYGLQKRGIDADLVILTGGFSASQALLNTVKEWLKKSYPKTPLRCAPKSESHFDVALGVLYRARDESNGPTRTCTLSLGTLCHLEYEELHPIKEQRDRCHPDPITNELWLRNVIVWRLRVGQGPLARSHQSDFWKSTHYFMPEDERWIAEEIAYVSDTCTVSDYQLDHPINEGQVSMLGAFECDFTTLKEKNLIKLCKPKGGKPHYKITVLIRVEIIDKDISLSMRWPPKRNVKPSGETSFCFVAGFRPGTE